jgi:DNA-binding response OmpR family regulator
VHVVVAAPAGALDAFRRDRPDLVILDLRLRISTASLPDDHVSETPS